MIGKILYAKTLNENDYHLLLTSYEVLIIILIINASGFFRKFIVMAKDKKERGMLSKAFWGAAKLATIGVVAAVAWQILLDPIFFPIIHNLPAYPDAAAWVDFVNDHTTFITDIIGFTGDGGLMQMDFMQAVLEPYYAQPGAYSSGYLASAAPTAAAPVASTASVTSAATTTSVASAPATTTVPLGPPPAEPGFSADML